MFAKAVLLVAALLAPAGAQNCNCTMLWYSNSNSTCSGSSKKLSFAKDTSTCFSDSCASGCVRGSVNGSQRQGTGIVALGMKTSLTL